MNRWILLLAALAAWASTAQAYDDTGSKVVCYYGSWAVYRPGLGKFDVEDIDPNLCTHLIYSFIGLGGNNDVRVLDSWNDLGDNYGKNAYGRLNELRKKNPKIKILIAIGGWNEGSAKYSTMASTEASRRAFVQDALSFVKKYGFDGLDVDWEYPAQRGGKPEDKQNFSKLLKELKTAFDSEKLILSAAVAAAEPSASQSYEISETCKYLDFVNIMTYDFHGSWERQTGHNAPLYPRTGETGNDRKLNVDASIQYWLSSGCPPEKVILGLATYGRSFTLADKNQNGLGSPTTGPGAAGPYTREGGMLGYNEICVNVKEGGWSVRRNEEQHVPYAFKDNQWVGYDDVESLNVKLGYLKKYNLGGAMTWSIETDDFRGSCGVAFPLLRTMYAAVMGGAPPPVEPKPTGRPSPSTQPPPTQPPPTQPSPPPSGICKKAGYVRDEQDCNVFYHCLNLNGPAHRFTCAPGLVFDTKINGCNFKSSVPECN